VLGPTQAGLVDRQPVLEGEKRMAVARRGGLSVPLQSRRERGERIRETAQERDHFFGPEQVLHHHEAHEVQAEVTRDRGRLQGCAQPALVGRAARRGGLVSAAMPG
jgi:hypothetical protein